MKQQQTFAEHLLMAINSLPDSEIVVFVVCPSDAEHHQRAQRRRQRWWCVQQIQHHQGLNHDSLCSVCVDHQQNAINSYYFL